MGPSRAQRACIFTVLLLAFALRLMAAVGWQQRLPPDQEFAFGDSYSYWVLAARLADGQPYEYAQSRVFRAPGYPLMLAVLFLISDEPPVLWARILGAFLGTAAVAGVACLAGQLFDRRVALLAGFLAAVYPGAIGMSVFVLSEAAFCPFMIGQIACWAAAQRAASQRSQVAYSAWAGCAAGLATLIRPSWLLFTPLAAMLVLLVGWRQRKHQVIAAVMLAATALTMAPWWIRNHRVTGTFVPTTLEIGASLYDGWNPAATGASDMRFVDEFRASHRQRAARGAADPSRFDVDLNRELRDAALAWARRHPGRVLELMVIKLRRMWSPWPNAAEFQQPIFRFVTAAGYLPLLILALWGAIAFWRRGWLIAWCWLPAIYLTALHTVFVSSIRYRQPAMLPLAILAAGVLASWLWRPGKDVSETSSISSAGR